MKKKNWILTVIICAVVSAAVTGCQAEPAVTDPTTTTTAGGSGGVVTNVFTPEVIASYGYTVEGFLKDISINSVPDGEYWIVSNCNATYTSDATIDIDCVDCTFEADGSETIISFNASTVNPTLVNATGRYWFYDYVYNPTFEGGLSYQTGTSFKEGSKLDNVKINSVSDSVVSDGTVRFPGPTEFIGELNEMTSAQYTVVINTSNYDVSGVVLVDGVLTSF